MDGLHIHLDPVGGVAGDMVLAALVDLRPDLAETALAAMRDAGLPAACLPVFAETGGGEFRGRRFALDGEAEAPPRPDPSWPAIRAALLGSRLDPAVRDPALAIFTLLAEAEAEVHGVDLEAVHFHELAAWDSLADIVGAAALIVALDPAGWSLAPLPLGGGTVRTAHGLLPVPAPATTLLLRGLPVRDDGIAGERVTPTGAAILRHLAPATAKPTAPHLLAGQGLGFGTRTLPGLPNCLRALALTPVADAAAEAAWTTETVTVIAFEVDDQSPEDLAIGLERLRALPGVLDLVQAPVFGKKGRMAAQIQLLCRPAARDAAIAACFGETTTLGLRWQEIARAALPRALRPGEPAVKLARRPQGQVTAKAEADDLAGVPGGRAVRRSLAETAEAAAVSGAVSATGGGC